MSRTCERILAVPYLLIMLSYYFLNMRVLLYADDSVQCRRVKQTHIYQIKTATPIIYGMHLVLSASNGGIPEVTQMAGLSI